MLLSASQIHGQQNSELVNSSDFYLQKSKNQITTAWILLGTGTAMIIGGAATFESTWNDDSSSATDAGGVVLLAGVIVDLVSIPFFISAGKNKRKVASFSLKFQENYLPRGVTPLNNRHLSLSVNISLQ